LQVLSPIIGLSLHDGTGGLIVSVFVRSEVTSGKSLLIDSLVPLRRKFVGSGFFGDVPNVQLITCF